MGNYLHRTTKQYLVSVSPNELQEAPANYIEDPDLSSVAGVPNRYWKITGDVITEMNQSEKDAVDASLLSDSRDATVAQIDDVESIIRQMVVSIVRELNIVRNWTVDFKAEVASATSLGDLQSRVAGLPDLPDRTVAQFKAQIRSDLGNGT